MPVSKRFTLLAQTTIGTAVSIVAAPTISNVDAARLVCVQAKFLYGAGGTTVDVYVQTSLDNGVTWADIMNFNFTTAAATKISAVSSDVALGPAITPTDGSIASNTILNGLIGNKFRVKYKSTGTYTGLTSIQVDMVAA